MHGQIELPLEHKVAMVTGANSGIGNAIGEVFACAGAKAVVTDVDAPGGDGVTAGIVHQGS